MVVPSQRRASAFAMHDGIKDELIRITWIVPR